MLHPFFRDGFTKFAADGYFSSAYQEHFGQPAFLPVSRDEVLEHIRANIGREFHPIAATFVSRMSGESQDRAEG
jgi:hypothetical protein